MTARTEPPASRPPVSRAVLVTGGAGYIGSHVVRMLLAAGRQVVVLDRLLFGAESLAAVRRDPNFRLIMGDIRDAVAVQRALRGADAVIHLAGIVGDPACALDPETTNAVNVAATASLVAAAHAAGVQRFVFASSCSVYGASDVLVDESSALHPVSLYAETKVAGEHIVLGARRMRFEPVVLRFATLHGWSPRPRLDLVANLLTAQAVRTGRITVFGGEQWRPFLHVADAAEALVAVLTAPGAQVSGEVFNIGSSAENYQIGSVGAHVAEWVPGTCVDIASTDGDRRDYRVSFARLERTLAFRPRRSLDDGIRELSVRAQAGDFAQIDDPRYSNVRTQEQLLARRIA